MIFTLSCGVCARTLEFWHPWPHANITVRRLANEYTRRTGVDIRIRVFNPSTYKPWTVGSTPDIIGLYNPTKPGVENLVRRGRAYNLGAEMRRGWYSSFWPGMLETFRIRGRNEGVYGVPLTGQVRLFVYNKTLFRRVGISRPPRTWSEMMLYSQKFRKIRIVPYAGGFGSNHPPLAHVYEWSYLGLHNLMQTYSGRYPYTASSWIRNLNIYSDMRIYGFTDAGWAPLSEVTAIKAMLDNRVAMVFVGPSFESIRRAYKPGFSDWGTFNAPIDARARFLPRLPGGVVEGVVVNRRSSNRTEAIRFIRWLTAYRQQVIMANGTSSIPATPGASFRPDLRSHLRIFASGMRDQSIDVRIYERSQVLNTYYGGVRRLLGGYTTPSAVAARTQAVKRR